MLPEDVLLTPLRIIATAGGPVMHGIKSLDAGYHGFGEAYFTVVEQYAVKGWKRHHRMVSNLVVPVGEIRLQLLDDRADSTTYGLHVDLTLGVRNYQRLTLPPGVWLAFQGRSAGLNMMLNLASIQHDPAESDTRSLDAPEFSAIPW